MATVSAAEQARREQQLRALLDHLTTKYWTTTAAPEARRPITAALGSSAYKTMEPGQFATEIARLARRGVEWIAFDKVPARAQDIPRDTPPELADALREAIQQRPQMQRAGRELEAKLVKAIDAKPAGAEREALEALRAEVGKHFNYAILSSNNPLQQARTEAVRALSVDQLKAIKPDSITDAPLRGAVVERVRAEAAATKLKDTGTDGLATAIFNSLKAAKIPEDKARTIAAAAMAAAFKPPSDHASFATMAEVTRAREAVFRAVAEAVKKETGLDVGKITDPTLRAAVVAVREGRPVGGETGARPRGAEVAGVAVDDPAVPVRRPGQSAYSWRAARPDLDVAVDRFHRTRAEYDRAERNTVGHMVGFEGYYIPDPDRTPPRPRAPMRRDGGRDGGRGDS